MNFFHLNHLIPHNQSGFKAGDSCINQLLSITHEIYKSFDDVLDVRGVFLDISKAFDKLWHKGLLYKLKQKGISGNLLDTITDFLNSIYINILIYINNLSDDLMTNVKLFADDTSLFSVVRDVNTSSTNLHNGLRKISDWAIQ